MIMTSRRIFYLLCIASSILSLLSSETLAKKPDTTGGGGGSGGAYTIIPFSLPGVTSVSSQVFDLNDLGAAVGGDNTAAGPKAVHLDITSNTYTVLDGVVAEGVNNLNQIVGLRVDYQAAFWASPTSAPVDLPPLSGHIWCGASAINDDGIVVGWSDPGPGPTWDGRAVVWKVNVDSEGDVTVAGPVPLPPLSGDTHSQANDVNELLDGSLQVVGISANEVDEFAVTWTVSLNGDGSLGTPTDAQSLGLPSWSRGYAINNFGTACGVASGFPFATSTTGLTLPDGATRGYAWDISDEDKVVGYLVIDSNKRPNISFLSQHAYLWSGGQPERLSDLLGRTDWVRLQEANQISNTGIIAGVGELDVEHRGFVAFPNE
jgi:uncharacterized membrane protein